MVEMLLRKAWFKPSMAVPIKVTVTTPMTMPSVVSPERSLFARIAPHEISMPSFSSVPKFMRKQSHSVAADVRRLELEKNLLEPPYVGCYGVDGDVASQAEASSLRFHQRFARVAVARFQAFVAGDQAIENPHDAPRALGNGFFVRHQNDRVPLTPQRIEQIHNFGAGLGIQIS